MSTPIKLISSQEKTRVESNLKKKKKKRCNHKDCKKKLSFIDNQMICKCKRCFCSIHRSITSHNCTANHIKINQEPMLTTTAIMSWHCGVLRQ